MIKRLLSVMLTACVLLSLTPLMAQNANAYSAWALHEGRFGPVIDEIAENARRDFIWPLAEDKEHNFNVYNIRGCFYDGRDHNAIDIACIKNTKVLASYEGRVVECRDGYVKGKAPAPMSYFGNYIVMEHKYTLKNGKTITLYTRYKHLNKISDRAKEAYNLRNDANNPKRIISKGEVIAYSGDTAAEGAYHLDFSILYVPDPNKSYNMYHNYYSKDPFGNNLLEIPSNLINLGTAEFDRVYFANVMAQAKIPICEYEHNVSSSFDSNGHCKGCQKAFDYMAMWDDGASAGVYRIKGILNEGYLYSEPYSASKRVLTKALRWGTELDVLGSVTNAFGKRWYRVSYESGGSGSSSVINGWIYEDELSDRIRKLKTTFDARVTSPGKTVKVREVCDIIGTVTSNQRISKITAWVENADGKIILKKVDCNPGTTEYKLNQNPRTPIDSALDFREIREPGSYVFRMDVTAGGETKPFSFPFTAYSSSKPNCTKPVISTVPVLGGMQVLLSSLTTGAKIYYTTDGSIPTAASNLYNANEPFVLTESTTVKAVAVKDGYNNADASAYVSIQEAMPPEILIEEIPEGNLITLVTEDIDSVIYCAVNGDTFNQVFNGFQFCASEDVTIKAYALSEGKKHSSWRILEPKVATPSIPTVMVTNNADIPAGDYINFLWGADKAAGSYRVTLRRDGTVIHQDTQTENSLSWLAEESGVYSLTVQSINAIGSSEESEAASVTVHAPSTVRFLDADTEAVLSELSVPYGGTIPAVKQPGRRGYEFAGWNRRGSQMVSLNGYLYETVTEDRDYIANYTPKIYTVTFLNTEGAQIVTREVPFGGAAVPPDYSASVPTGCVFSGWTVVHSDDNSSLCDYTCVDSNLELQAVVQWGNRELPVVVTIGNAALESGVGYVIPVTLTNWDEAVSSVWVCYALKNTNASGVEKTVYMDREAVSLQPGETRSVFPSKVIDYAGNASKVEVLVLERKSDGTTGSAYSLAADKEIAAGHSWTDWSEWSTEEPEAQEGRAIEQKTQYRFRTKETTTSTDPALSGWVQNGSSTYWSDYGPWSAWTRTAITANDATQVETTALYRYYYFYCPVCKGHEPFQGTSDCGKYTLTGERDWHAEWFPTPYSQSNSRVFSYTSEKRYTTSLGDGQIWCFSSANLNDTAIGTKDNHNSSNPEVIVKGYRSRTRTEITEYSYYKWTEWTGWSDQEQLPSDTVEVGTRTLYRYRDELTYYVPGQEDTDGVVRSCSGSLDIDSDLSGKAATVMVYQSKNMDANQYQMKYIGQTVLGAGNTYDFSFIPASEPTADTGNYVIALGVQGTTGLLNVGLLEAPKRSYTVQFYYVDGSESVILSTQTVEEGSAAEVPAAPQRPGYVFAGWSGRSTNILSSCSIEALYVPERYALAFVDYANETASVQTATAGTAIVPPPSPEAVGKTFLGWDVLINDPSAVVTGNTVVTAVYETSRFYVDFHNAAGAVIDSQTVEYGCAAVPPTAPDVEEGYAFLGWDTSVMWWNVTSDLDVYPIVVFAETAMAPMSSVESGTMGLSAYLELESEPGATIYYTTDGTDPTTESEIYTEGFYLVDTTQVLAMACVDGKNDSEVVEVFFLYDETPVEEETPIRSEVVTQELAVEPGKEYELQVSIDNNPGLCGYLLYLDCDLSVFGLNIGSEADEGVVPGAASEGGTVSLTSDGADGWQVLWLSSEPNQEDGVLFTLPIYVGDAGTKAAADPYTITLSYAPQYTYSEDFEEVAGDFSLLITSTSSVTLGDVNEDGTVDANDLTALARHVARIETLVTAYQLEAADVNQDGSIDAADLTSLARFVAKITTSFD